MIDFDRASRLAAWLGVLLALVLALTPATALAHTGARGKGFQISGLTPTAVRVHTISEPHPKLALAFRLLAHWSSIDDGDVRDPLALDGHHAWRRAADESPLRPVAPPTDPPSSPRSPPLRG